MSEIPRVCVAESYTPCGSLADIAANVTYPNGKETIVEAFHSPRNDGSSVYEFSGLPSHLDTPGEVFVVTVETQLAFFAAQLLRESEENNARLLTAGTMTIEEYVIKCAVGLVRPYNSDNFEEST